MARGEALVETAVGALVLAGAGVFIVYALASGGVRAAGQGYEVVAKFGQVGSLATGADVRVAGVKVGAVTALTLDPKTYLAEAHMTLDPKVQLPSDSSAKVTSDGLLGGEHVAIAPGGSSDMLKPGGEIENTQGAVDLFGLIGQAIRPTSEPSPEATAPAAATPR
jgi:phospholipid/cholesterol/gamma-HCH transport system substrate-binding protein